MVVRVVAEQRASHVTKEQIRILNHLNDKGNYVAPDPFDPTRMLLVIGARQPSRVCGTVAASAVRQLQSNGAIEAARTGSTHLILNEAGHALLKRTGGGLLSESEFQAQHQVLRMEDQEEGGRQPLVVNDAESPLAWLRRRRNRDGSPMLDETRYVAGERLRTDMTRAQMLPRVTSNWTAAVASSARGQTAMDPTDTMVAARQRVNRALTAVGPDLAGVLIDVCGFLKGIADVEKERNWPARSGKVVLDIALGRLAAFYGLSQEAVGTGPGHREIRAWAASDGRPLDFAVQTAEAAS